MFINLDSTQFLKRLLWSLVAIVFFCTNHLGISLYAQEASQVPSIETEPIPQDLSTLQVPQEMGKVQEFHKGRRKQTILLIQDAHAIPEAQRSIHKLIGYFQKEYGINLVAVEGTSSRLDPQIFRSFPDKELLKKVFEDYHARGELTGGTAAAIFNEKEAVYQGIEDWDLYEKGLGFYLEALEKESKIQEKLQSLRQTLEAKKQKHYSKKLLSLDRTLEAFYENHANLLRVLKELTQFKKPSQGTEISLLIQEIERSTQMVDSSLEIEVKNIALKVQSFLKFKTPSKEIKSRLTTFNEKFQEFQTSQTSPESFALFLRELAAEFGLSLPISERLNHLMENQKTLRDLQGTKLFKDLEGYIQEVKETLFRNAEERAIDRENEYLRLLGRLSRLELGPEDWEEIKSLKQEIDSDFRPHLAFYETVEKRDQVFFERVKTLMQKEKVDTLLVVTGGFHTEDLAKELKAGGFSYLSLIPHMDSVPKETNYRNHMQGQVSWKDYFEVEKGKINLYKAFVRGTRDRLLKESKIDQRQLLKSWRDQIIRDLAEKGQITKVNQYTPFIDELVRKESTPPQWYVKVEQFIEGLRQLESRNQLTEQNILKLFKPATIPPAVTAAPLGVRSKLRVNLLPSLHGVAQSIRSEARTEVNPFTVLREDYEITPNLESAKEAIRAIIEDFIGLGIEPNKKITYYLNHLNEAVEIEGPNRTAGTLFAKTRNLVEPTSNWTITLNPEWIYYYVMAGRKLGTDVFIEIFSTVFREVEGFWLTQWSESEEEELKQGASEILHRKRKEFLQSRGVSPVHLAFGSQPLGEFLKDSQQAIKHLAAIAFAGEAEETLENARVLKELVAKGIYSPKRANQRVEELIQQEGMSPLVRHVTFRRIRILQLLQASSELEILEVDFRSMSQLLLHTLHQKGKPNLVEGAVFFYLLLAYEQKVIGDIVHNPSHPDWNVSGFLSKATETIFTEVMEIVKQRQARTRSEVRDAAQFSKKEPYGLEGNLERNKILRFIYNFFMALGKMIQSFFNPEPRPRRIYGRRLAIETLEDRTLLNGAFGDEDIIRIQHPPLVPAIYQQQSLPFDNVRTMSPSTSLTTSDITQLPGNPKPIADSAYYAATPRGIRIQFDNSVSGRAAAGLTFDQYPETPDIIETADLSGFQFLVFGVRGDTNELALRMGDDKRHHLSFSGDIRLVGVSPTEEKVYAIPTSAITEAKSGFDLTHVWYIDFGVLDPNAKGFLDVNWIPGNADIPTSRFDPTIRIEGLQTLYSPGQTISLTVRPLDQDPVDTPTITSFQINYLTLKNGRAVSKVVPANAYSLDTTSGSFRWTIPNDPSVLSDYQVTVKVDSQGPFGLSGGSVTQTFSIKIHSSSPVNPSMTTSPSDINLTQGQFVTESDSAGTVTLTPRGGKLTTPPNALGIATVIFDDPATTAKETGNFSGVSQIVMGLQGSNNETQLIFKDTDSLAHFTLTRVSAQEQIYTISIPSLIEKGIDPTRLENIFYVGSGILTIHHLPPPSTPLTPDTVENVVPSAYGNVQVRDLPGSGYEIVTSSGVRLGPGNEVREVVYRPPNEPEYVKKSDYIKYPINPQFNPIRPGLTIAFKHLRSYRNHQNPNLPPGTLPSHETTGILEPMSVIPNFVRINNVFLPLTVTEISSTSSGIRYRVSFTVPHDRRILKNDGKDELVFYSIYDNQTLLTKKYAISPDGSVIVHATADFPGYDIGRHMMKITYRSSTQGTGNRQILSVPFPIGTSISFDFTPNGQAIRLKGRDQMVAYDLSGDQVTSQNPIVQASEVQFEYHRGDTVSLSVSASDPDGDTVVMEIGRLFYRTLQNGNLVTVVVPPDSYHFENGVVTWTIPLDAIPASYNFAIHASGITTEGGFGGFTNRYVTIRVVDETPTQPLTLAAKSARVEDLFPIGAKTPAQIAFDIARRLEQVTRGYAEIVQITQPFFSETSGGYDVRRGFTGVLRLTLPGNEGVREIHFESYLHYDSYHRSKINYYSTSYKVLSITPDQPPTQLGMDGFPYVFTLFYTVQENTNATLWSISRLHERLRVVVDKAQDEVNQLFTQFANEMVRLPFEFITEPFGDLIRRANLPGVQVASAQVVEPYPSSFPPPNLEGDRSFWDPRHGVISPGGFQQTQIRGQAQILINIENEPTPHSVSVAIRGIKKPYLTSRSPWPQVRTVFEITFNDPVTGESGQVIYVRGSSDPDANRLLLVYPSGVELDIKNEVPEKQQHYLNIFMEDLLFQNTREEILQKLYGDLTSIFEQGRQLLQSLFPQGEIQIPPMNSGMWNVSLLQTALRRSTHLNIYGKEVVVDIVVDPRNQRILETSIWTNENRRVGIGLFNRLYNENVDDNFRLQGIMLGVVEKDEAFERSTEEVKRLMSDMLREIAVGDRVGNPQEIELFPFTYGHFHEVPLMLGGKQLGSIAVAAFPGIPHSILHLARDFLTDAVNNLRPEILTNLANFDRDRPIRYIVASTLSEVPEFMRQGFPSSVLGITWTKSAGDLFRLFAGRWRGGTDLQRSLTDLVDYLYEFGRVAVHEFGHVVRLIGTHEPVASELLDSIASDIQRGVHRGTYSSTHPEEGFAEDFSAYLDTETFTPFHYPDTRAELVDLVPQTTELLARRVFETPNDQPIPSLNPNLGKVEDIRDLLFAALTMTEGAGNVQLNLVPGTAKNRNNILDQTSAVFRITINGLEPSLWTATSRRVAEPARSGFELALSSGTASLNISRVFVKEAGQIVWVYQISGTNNQPLNLLNITTDEARLKTLGQLIKQIAQSNIGQPPVVELPIVQPPVELPVNQPLVEPPIVQAPVNINPLTNISPVGVPRTVIDRWILIYLEETNRQAIIQISPFLGNMPSRVPSIESLPPFVPQGQSSPTQNFRMYLPNSVPGRAETNLQSSLLAIVKDSNELINLLSELIPTTRTALSIVQGQVQIRTPQGQVRIIVNSERVREGYKLTIQGANSRIELVIDSSGNLLQINNRDVSNLSDRKRLQNLREQLIRFLQSIGFLRQEEANQILGNQEARRMEEKNVQAQALMLLIGIGFFGDTKLRDKKEEKEEIPSRSEVRESQVPKPQEVARRTVYVFFHSQEAGRIELRVVAKEVVYTLQVVPANEFGETVRSEARLLLDQVEKEQRVPATVTVDKKLAEKAIAWFTSALVTGKFRNNLAVAFDTEANPSLLDALRRMKSKIGLAFFQKEMSKGIDRKELKGLTFQFVGNLGLYRPSQAMTVQNSEALPVVNDTLQADYFGTNGSLFGVGVSQADIEGEPYLEVVEKVVQIVTGLLVAERIKKASDLKNPAKVQEIKAELLKQLFQEQTLPDIVAFQNGNIVVNRSYLRSFITEYLARAEIRKAA